MYISELSWKSAITHVKCPASGLGHSRHSTEESHYDKTVLYSDSDKSVRYMPKHTTDPQMGICMLLTIPHGDLYATVCTLYATDDVSLPSPFQIHTLKPNLPRDGAWRWDLR